MQKFILSLLLLTTILSPSNAEFQIRNYTLSHLATLTKGIAKVQDGTFKIIHLIRLEEYRNFIKNIEVFVNNNAQPENMFTPSLKHELMQVTEMLRSLHVTEEARAKRSINIIGTAWKYIAGSPDHDDFELIKNNINELNTNNNEQMIINEGLTRRINKLTEYTNIMNKIIKSHESEGNVAIISMQTRLRLVKEELQNIKYAIQWAKNNIINSVILNKEEIKIVTKTLKKEKFPFETIEEALEFANVKVLYKDSTLLYVIQIPLTSEEIYNKVLLKPIKKNNKIIDIKFKKILKNKENIFAMIGNCNIINAITICKRNNLINIVNSTCIPPLLNGSQPHCNISDAFHIPEVEELESGIILLNDFHGFVNNQSMNGTYLITFHNESVNINNKTYRNLEAPIVPISAQIVQQTPLERQYIKILSLEKLSQLHINNTNKIGRLETEAVVGKSLFGIIIVMFMLTLISLKFICKTKEKIIFRNTSDTKITLNQDDTVGNIPTNKSFNESIILITSPPKPPRLSTSNV